MSSNKFWIERPNNLIESSCLVPTKNMSNEEKLNTLSRLTILISLAIMVFNFKSGIQFLVVGMILLIAYNSCLDKDDMNYTTLAASTPSAGIVASIGNGGYGNYAPNANSNTALFVGVPFQANQQGSLNAANEYAADTWVIDDESTYPPEAHEAGSAVGGGWGYGWTPSNGLNFQTEMDVVQDGSLTSENNPYDPYFQTVDGVDSRANYAALTDDLVYQPYNTVYNNLPDSGIPTAPGYSGQWAPGVVPYTNPNYLQTAQVPMGARHMDAGSGVPNAGTPGMAVDGSYNPNAMGASRLAADGFKKKASTPFIASNTGAHGMALNPRTARNPRTSRAGSTSDYSTNGYSNLYSGDSGNNDPEHYVTLDRRVPINPQTFINPQDISSYQPVSFTQPIDRSERLDAKTFQLWKDLTMFDKNPPKDAVNKMMDYTGTQKISDQSYNPTYYKSASSREEIKKNTFSSFLNERIAQDHGILDDIPEFRRQMMRDYTPLRRRAISFRAGNNAPREYAAPGNIPLTPLRPPMTPSPSTPGF